MLFILRQSKWENSHIAVKKTHTFPSVDDLMIEIWGAKRPRWSLQRQSKWEKNKQQQKNREKQKQNRKKKLKNPPKKPLFIVYRFLPLQGRQIIYWESPLEGLGMLAHWRDGKREKDRKEKTREKGRATEERKQYKSQRLDAQTHKIQSDAIDTCCCAMYNQAYHHKHSVVCGGDKKPFKPLFGSLNLASAYAIASNQNISL